MVNRGGPFDSLGGVVGGLIGFGLVWYVGLILVVPGVAGVAILALFTETPVKPRHFAFAIGILGAHALWFVVGALLGGDPTAALIDATALLAAVAWLWARPSRTSALATAGLLALILVYNVVVLVGAAVGTLEHRALVAHATLRVCAILALMRGLRGLPAVVAPPSSGVEADE